MRTPRNLAAPLLAALLSAACDDASEAPAPDATVASADASFDPDASVPDASTSPDVHTPDAVRPAPDAAHGDAAASDGPEPDGPPPDALPDVPDPDAALPDGPDPDAARPDGPDPDAALPDGALPDRPEPDAALPDAAAPDGPPPCVPLEEVCNGIDDDCDDAVDEDLGATRCGVGPCEHEQPNCVDGRPVACDPFAGAADEICNGVDDDCDDAIDEALGATRCGVGLCDHEQPNCVDGQLVECDPLAGATDEICNGADDDCDEEVDEELPLDEWYPDPDGDGFHGPTPSLVQPSCAAWLAAGGVDDGVYPVDPDGPEGPASALDVLCDQTRDGGGWTRVFFHDVAGGYWAGDVDAWERSPEDPLALRYSILSRLEAFRSSDDLLDLRLEWPDSGIPGRNIWRQRSNPTSEPIAGYEPVDVDYTDRGWGGLEHNRFNRNAFIDGTVGVELWFYALGTTAPWGDPPGIPAYNVPAQRVALWVRPDDEVATEAGAPALACGPLEARASAGGDCDPDDPRAYPGAEEVCDGVDNDCDGGIDEGFDQVTWYPDRDGDGQGAALARSCAGLLASGVVADGVYTVWPDGAGGPPLSVYCDMTRDEGGWTRVFFHDVVAGPFAAADDAHSSHPDDPLALRYSILDTLEAFREGDGDLVMRIEWPDTGHAGRNIWRQRSNPTAGPVEGYVAIDVDHPVQGWGGLERSQNPASYVDGTVGHVNWYFSIGTLALWGSPPGIPAYDLDPAERVALWVRGDPLAGESPVVDCAPPDGYVDVSGDCDDGDPEVAVGAEELCNGVDDDCDGSVDEGCPFGDAALTRMPQPLHFYPRDRDTGTCSFTVEGALQGAATEVQVQAFRDGEALPPQVSDAASFAVEVTLEGGLHRYDVRVSWDDGRGSWRPLGAAEDVVCGDVFVVDGQSNAVAQDYHGERLGDLERDPFVRSFGSSVLGPAVADDERFGIAVADGGLTHAAIGQWGLRLANALREARQVPILVINGAVGGTRVDQHQRNDANPEDLSTIYGRLLWRVRRAGVADAVRGIVWHQGESDGALPYDTYLERFSAMYEDWLADYPNVEGVFVFQVRAGCASPVWVRDVHRDLPALLPRVLGNMSTLGVDGHDGCHFFHDAYAEWGERMARLVLRELYDAAPPGNIDAPSPRSAVWTAPMELTIEFGETGGGLELQPGAAAWFSLSDGAAVVDARVDGSAVVLTTAAPSAAGWVSFEDVPGDIPWLVNDLGVGAFSWRQLPIGQ